MKTVNGRYYNALHVIGTGAADLWERERVNVETVKRAIDERNERSIKAGYKADQYIITLVTWENFTDDNGLFIASSKSEKAVCIYPENITE